MIKVDKATGRARQEPCSGNCGEKMLGLPMQRGNVVPGQQGVLEGSGKKIRGQAGRIAEAIG